MVKETRIRKTIQKFNGCHLPINEMWTINYFVVKSFQKFYKTINYAFWYTTRQIEIGSLVKSDQTLDKQSITFFSAVADFKSIHGGNIEGCSMTRWKPFYKYSNRVTTEVKEAKSHLRFWSVLLLLLFFEEFTERSVSTVTVTARRTFTDWYRTRSAENTTFQHGVLPF